MKENPRKVSKSAIKSENALNEKEDFIMLPTVDFCFKELMQNENVRKGIIAAILNRRPDEIVNTELLPTILRKDSEDDKYGILDVWVQLDNEVQIDFEMQVVYYDYWANRTIYYLSKMYTEQIREGDSYDRLQKCIQVSILAHVLFQEDEECYRRISFCDVKTGKEYTDLMEMHILELPKLPPEQKSETDLMQWMRFLNGKRREDFEKMAKKNSCFEEAYKEYYPVIYRYVRCRIRCKYEVEDLVQDVFMRLLDYDNMLQKSTIQSFLFTIARNLVIDYLRCYYKKQEMILCAYENFIESTCGPEEEIIAKDLLIIERLRLSAFPQQRRKIYSMSRFEEKTLCEISEELQLSKSTVENHLFIGRKVMRNYISMCI